MVAIIDNRAARAASEIDEVSSRIGGFNRGRTRAIKSPISLSLSRADAAFPFVRATKRAAVRAIHRTFSPTDRT